MNKDLKTKVVFAGILAGASTMTGIIPLKAMPIETPGVSSIRREVVVSPAALQAIDAKVQQATVLPGPTQERFYQIIRGPFVESGPEFVQSWKGQMRLP